MSTGLGFYLRLSMADGDLGKDNKDESNSIENQRELLQSFVESKEEFTDEIFEYIDDGYEDVYICALLLIFPSLIDVPQQIARTTLMVSDIVKEQGLIYVLMAAVNVVLSLILLPTVGVVGAAFSVCVAYLVRTAAFNVLYHKRLPVDLGYYFKSTYGRWLLVAGGTLLAGSFVQRLPMSSWFGLLFKAVLIGAVYIALTLVVGLDHATRNLVVMKIKNQVHKEN